MKTKYRLLLASLLFSGAMMAADIEAAVIPTLVGASTGEIDLTVSGGVAPFVYTWSGPGGFSSTDEDLTGLSSGTYTVTVTDQYCGIATMEVVIGEINDVSIEEIPLFELSVYPNPTNGLIFIKSTESLDLVLYSIVGEVVLSAKNASQLDLTGQATGVYMLQATSHKGVRTEKITLTR